ncbi:hypothetical protein GCM10008018_13090 [Paenibacillus marchantiophytorum]|uniref:Uncharacterized protein n=1 Tax=Paenibacillus marchantiophytorum TaxID=1619310 RepID=A0ABQ2BR59_9BACL|nr:hypothetical protein [Paenibacillus marchantiophytorum]GGI45624.1 hypothetical protein GCM10008018_13090 [Paenibacillus marchantiophytorum]
MKFCLYDTKYDRIILIEKSFLSALELKDRFGMSVDIAILPILSKKEYMSFPSSFRGEVSGRSYLLYEVPGVIEQRYDQVIVQE